MRKGGYIKEPYRDVVMNKNIYIYNEDKIKQPNQHRIIVLDFLAELVYNGFEIEIFEIEKSWYDGKYRSDAFVVGLFAGRRYHFFLEIQLSNNYHHLDKYDELYKTNDVQAFLGKNYYPNRIVLVSDKEYPQIKLERCKVIQLNTKLNNFPTIFMDLDK